MSILHHVEIYVKDLSTTRKFYDMLFAKLGYKLYQEWSEGVSYTDGDCYIVFVQTAKKYLAHAYHRCHIGLNHLAFKCKSNRQVDDYRKFLIEQNVPLLYDERYPYAGGDDYYAVFFEDPDCIKLEIVAHPQSSQ